MTRAASRGERATALVATTQTWSSTAVLPLLLAAAGLRTTTLSPRPMAMSRSAHIRLGGSRDPGDCARQVRDIVLRQRIDWVVPADDTLLRALVAANDPALRGRLPVDPDDVRATDFVLSNHAFTKRAGEIGINVPQSAFAASADEAAAAATELGYPVVVKGPHGFAGIDVAIARDQIELRKHAKEAIHRWGHVLVQRFIDGKPAGVSVVYLDGKPLGWKPYMADCCYPNAMAASSVHDAFDHPEIEPVVRAVGAESGLSGFAAIDFMVERSTGMLHALEVNPRPTLGFAGSRANRAFFAPIVRRFIAREAGAPAIFGGPRRPQVFFPTYLFYAATNRSAPQPRRSLLIDCLREFVASDAALAAWQVARFLRDETTRRWKTPRSFSSFDSTSSMSSPVSCRAKRSRASARPAVEARHSLRLP